MKEHELLPARLDSSHTFDGEGEGCVKCGKVRALHLYDGFRPSLRRSIYTDDPAVRFRGPHPRWRVRFVKQDEQDIYISPEARQQADRIRSQEARQIAKALLTIDNHLKS